MKKIALVACLIALLFVSGIEVFSQKEPIKFGKISDEEWLLTRYEKDTNASAVVLCDYGKTDFIYSDNQGLQVQYDQITRIKIFNKEGYDRANFKFLIHKQNAKIGKIKGTTYTNEDGKILKTKLDNDQIFRENYNKYYDILKFEMPAVKEGSIVEVEYSVISESWHINEWRFQTGIPTIHSEYRVSVPEYFYYKQLEKGFFPIGNKFNSTRRVQQTTTDKYRSEGYVTKTYTNIRNFDYQVTDYTFISTDVPAFYEEEYLTTENNYLSAIQFELGTIKWPNQPIKNYTTTWEAISKLLLEDSDFGSRINGGWAIKDEMELIGSQNNAPENKIAATYELVRNKMHWDNRNSIYSMDQGKAWKEGSGSSGDINLLLVAALRKLDIEAYPVILSTRANGFIHPAQIIIDQFNYVIAAVKLNEKYILLDATDKNSPLGVIPERCLNGQGRLISDKGGEWIDLKPGAANKKTYQFKLEVNTEGELIGSANEKYEGYAALEKRAQLKYHSSDSLFLADYQKGYSNLTMSLDSISDKNNLTKALVVNYQFTSENLIEKSGNLWMIQPFIIGRKEVNPFKLEKRDYPVDYAMPNSVMHMVSFTLPEGFVVENLPETKKLILPDRNTSFTYSVQQSGNSIIVVSKFDINKIIFLPDEYEALKEFYNQVIAIQAQQIVLKKN